jgi:hypothetical protein
LNLGAVNATSVSIASAAATTAIRGGVTIAGSFQMSGAFNLIIAAGQGLDTASAGTLTVGGTTATALVIGRVGVSTGIPLLNVGSGQTGVVLQAGTGQANFIQFAGAAPAGTPTIGVAGTDANIALNLQGKGNFGYILLANQAANFVQVSGGASGTSPLIGAFGSDPNINLILQPRGTGVIDFNYPTVALGGGAAPTLGTIGGSGPATAAQNSWLKMNVNGVASYLPLWR